MNGQVSQRGFSLVETLVSILVLAIGVIGAAGMQLTALRTSKQSAMQTAALELASELADNMRANDIAMRASSASGGTGNPFLGLDYRTSDEAPSPTMQCYGADASCDATGFASFDIYEWERRVKDALPIARAVVCRDAMPWNAAAKAYKWECDNAENAPVTIKLGWQSRNPDGSLIRDADKTFSPSIALVVEPYVR